MLRVLLIAYHFPPLIGSSGIQRTLRFAKYLPEFGWQPVVLTAHKRAYENIDPRSERDIPQDCIVVRSQALDAARHLSFFGRYPRRFADPDRWASWATFGIRDGVEACKRLNIQAIWSSYPIATAHKIGAGIAQRTGLPWIADFRDPMVDEGFPEEPIQRRSFQAIDQLAGQHAARMVFVTPSALARYRARYPGPDPKRFVLIENGYDEEAFASSSASAPARTDQTPVILHSGIVYPLERDPTNLFAAIQSLARAEKIRPGDFRIRFRASHHDTLLNDLASRFGVAQWVEIAPQIPYGQALAEMLDADGLLLMQGAICNEQIPAKLYEYVRARRPILGLADPVGDTGKKLRALGIPDVAALESQSAIEDVLLAFIRSVAQGTTKISPDHLVAKNSRRHLTRELANVLDELVAPGRPARATVAEPSRATGVADSDQHETAKIELRN